MQVNNSYIRKIDRGLYLLKIFGICCAYQEFGLREAYRDCIGFSLSESEAVQACEIAKSLYGISPAPEDFLDSDNELSDNSIIRHHNYLKWLKMLEGHGVTEKEMDSFCKSIHFGPGCPELFRHYKEVCKRLSLLVGYSNRVLSKDEFLVADAGTTISGATLRMVMRQIENLYEEISIKQKSRKLKQHEHKQLL